MNYKSLKQLLIIALFWLWPAALPAVTPPLPAQPPQYVVDLAGVLNPETRALLNASLKDLEARTTAQVVVLTVNSLEGEPIESFSHQTAVKWGIGQKGKDNGVLFTLAVKDHKYRIEVGYGLESTLPDSLVGSLGRQYLVPNFRQGNYAAGITAVVNTLSEKISGGKVVGAGGPPPPAKTARKSGSRSSISPLTAILLPIFIIFIVLNLLRRARKGGGGGFIWFGGGGGGGWSSGGDSGGFSGGGGDFGGGGASGDW